MIECEDRAGIAVLRMRHGKANAMDLEFCRAISAAVGDAAEARAIILTGEGNIFSAGVDLFRFVAEGRSYIDAFLPALAHCFETVFTAPRPVVAALNGHAIAGGCVLGCAADLRLMSAGNGRVGVPEVYVGVPFPPIAVEILRYAVAPQHLQTIMLDGETVPAGEARRRGLIDDVVESTAVLDDAIARAERLATVSPEVYALTKRQLRAPALARAHDDSSDLGTQVDAQWASEEVLARIRRYLDETFGDRAGS